MKNRIVLTALTFAVFLIPLMAINPAVAAETNKNDADTYRLLNLFGDVMPHIYADAQSLSKTEQDLCQF